MTRKDDISAKALDLARAVTARKRAGGDMPKSAYLPDVPRQAHANGGYVPMMELQPAQMMLAKPRVVQSAENPLQQLLTPRAAPGSSGVAEPQGTAPQAAAPAGQAEHAEGISGQAQAALDALRSGWTGQEFGIVSGYRDPQTNADVGGAKDSQHIHGNAFDIDTSGWTPEQKVALANEAKAAGFTGFGFYDNNLHFDVGAPRVWGPSYGRDSVPDWANSFVEAHGYASGGGVKGLYSKAAQVVRALPQDKFNVDQALAMLASRGVKPAELANAGRPDGKSITKEGLAAHFESKVPPVGVQRTDREGRDPELERLINAQDTRNLTVAEIDRIGELMKDEIEPKYHEWTLDGVGHMYEDSLDIGDHNTLDREKPLKDQHPEVQQALRRRYGDRHFDHMVGQNYSGAEIANRIENREHMREMVDAGLRAISYKDAGSRDREGGTRNFVVFDDKHVKVRRRYANGGAAWMKV